jgi:adenylosuccinate lyase
MTIDRYQDPEIRSILSKTAQTRRWFEVEAAWLAARFNVEIPIPTDFTGLAIAATHREQVHGHDVLAFVETVGNRWPDEHWATHQFHYGLTSSDVVDTAESLMIRELSHVLTARILDVHMQLLRLTAQATGYCWTTTHGRQAEPMIVGNQFHIWGHRCKDLAAQLAAGSLDNAEGRFRGPAGSDGRPGTAERVACARLHLEPATACFQALNRETRATWHHAVASGLAVLDGLAHHLKRWICEERDGFLQLEWDGGVPSSSMIKRNPTTLERVHGLSALFASMQSAALHVVPMWDEREIAHSSVDRILHESGAHWFAFAASSIEQVLSRCSVVPGLETRPVSSFASTHNLITNNGMTRAQAREEVSKATP